MPAEEQVGAEQEEEEEEEEEEGVVEELSLWKDYVPCIPL